MAATAPIDRSHLARVHARRRAVRARIVAAVAAAPAGSGGAGFEVVRLFGALAVVVGLAFAARWWVRRTGLARPFQGGAFEVVSRHALGGGQSVLVARFGSRLLCIGHGRDGMRTLCELAEPSEVAAAIAEARGTSSAGASDDPAVRTVDLRRKDGRP